MREVTCGSSRERRHRSETTDSVMPALSLQLVSIATEADQNSLLLYKTVVLTAPCGTKLDRGVLFSVTAPKVALTTGRRNRTVERHLGYTRPPCAKSGAGECGFLSGPPSAPETTLFLCARMPKIGTTTLAVLRVRWYESLRVTGTKIAVLLRSAG